MGHGEWIDDVRRQEAAVTRELGEKTQLAMGHLRDEVPPCCAR